MMLWYDVRRPAGAPRRSRSHSVWRCAGCLRLQHGDAKRPVAARARARWLPGAPPHDVVEQRRHRAPCRHVQFKSSTVVPWWPTLRATPALRPALATWHFARERVPPVT